MLSLSPPVFLILRRAIEEHTGLHYGDNDAELLAAKMTPRAIELGFDSLLDYYYFLRYDADGKREMDVLAEQLVVNETYFFREIDPLLHLVERFLRPRVDAGQRVRVWSAACATGEEPLTLAMLLATRGLLAGTEIVASDLSGRALKKAMSGCYEGRALRALPHSEMRPWLTMDGKIDPALVRAIDWRQLNLLDSKAIAALGRFDAVICRNVLIYFSYDTTEQVLLSLTRALANDGVLLVGVSESLLRFETRVRCEEHAGCFFYKARAS